MTLRQLAWMSASKKEFGGDLVGWLLKHVTAAIWSPSEMPKQLNPFSEPKPVSEAMQKHLESWAKRRWRAASGG